MKILHIIKSVNPQDGGPIEGVLRQAEVWRQLGHTREIVTLDSPFDPWVQKCPVRVHPLGLRSRHLRDLQRHTPWQHYGYSPHFVPWIKAHVGTYDAVIVNGLWNYCALGANIALRKSPVPYFVFTHGMLNPWFRKHHPLKHWVKQAFWLFADGPLVNRSTAVFFTSAEERLLSREEFKPWHPKEIVVGYGTADVVNAASAQVEAFYGKLPILRGRRFLLFLGRLHAVKACDILIAAFARIAADHPDLDLVIAGPDRYGLQPGLQRLARDEGVDSRIHWSGALMDDDKWGAFRAAEAFVLPSHSENFGIVVAEALACSTPVLISDKVNIWREVVAGGGGLAGPDTVAGFANVLRRFLDLGAEDRARMRRAARSTFVDHFNVETVAKNMVDLLHSLGVTGDTDTAIPAHQEMALHSPE